MAACKDRLVNIPIQAADIESTLSNIPRTPREAGLLEVKLKRKLGYKNTHQHSYIDPEKIYKALDLLKSTGHPDYCFYDDYNAYKNRVNSSSFIKFVDDYNIDEIVEKDVYELCFEKEKKKQEETNFVEHENCQKSNVEQEMEDNSPLNRGQLN